MKKIMLMALAMVFILCGAVQAQDGSGVDMKALFESYAAKAVKATVKKPEERTTPPAPLKEAEPSKSSLPKAPDGLSATVAAEIPGLYMLVKMTGAKGGPNFDASPIQSYGDKLYQNKKYEQIQIAVYDQGKKEGDGLRALGSWDADDSRLLDNSIDHPKVGQLMGLLLESVVGYYAYLEHLYLQFSKNPALAQKSYGRAYVMGYGVISQVIRGQNGDILEIIGDYSNKPAVRLSIRLNTSWLQELKRGDAVFIRGRTSGFEDNLVTMRNGQIIAIVNDDDPQILLRGLPIEIVALGAILQ